MDDKEFKYEDIAGVKHQDTIFVRDGKWYWADETWDEHGPCDSEEDARSRQSLYCSVYLYDEKVHGMRHVSCAKWNAKNAAEPPGALHPCTCAAAWDCDCGGSCSCHWED